MKVAVCIVTYRRPEGLRRLLDALSRLEVDGDPGTAPEIEVIVVDNDPAGSAAPVLDEAAGAFPWPLRHDREEGRGIARARNRAVAIALDSDSPELIAFIDDDERPEPSWLCALLHAREEYGADIVAGPALPEFEPPVVEWIVRGGFFERARYPTGTRMHDARTSNVLIGADVFRALAPAFDERFGLTGGEDTHFFARAFREGFRIVWADEAVVREYVPRSRTRSPWLLKRAFRAGSVTSMIAYDLEPTARTRLSRVVKGCGRIAQGFVMLPAVAVGGRPALLRCGQKIFLGVGALMGVLGVTYEEYGRTM